MKALIRPLEDLARRLRRPRARHHLRRGLDVEGFFAEMGSRNVRYVVLRWFETLPVVEPGEDLDLLVADDDIARIDDLFGPWRAGRACDVYSVSGLPGSEFRKMAYYPPHLAARMLDRAVRLNGRFRVPCTGDHFHSLAYHALYHKGHASGLPSATPPAQAIAKRPDHDYAAALSRLADDLGIDVTIDLESLDAHLQSVGWRPPLDMLARLGLRNPWLAGRIQDSESIVPVSQRGLAVFVVRQRALEIGRDDVVAGLLRDEGFALLASTALSAAQQAASALRLRGGNWGRGPYALAGGPPAVVHVAWDGHKLPVEAKARADYPLLDNARVLRAKLRVRDALIDGLPRSERFNPLHSSDNDAQAWEYLEALMPEELEPLREKVARLNAADDRS